MQEPRGARALRTGRQNHREGPATDLDAPLQHLPELLTTRPRVCLHRPDLVEASVLLPLFRDQEGKWCVLFTLRTQTVKHHKGQVSFPCGARHAEDHDLEATALRETLEEVGIAPECVRVFGPLDDVVTISNYMLRPYVGEITWPQSLVISEVECQEVFWVPLEHLLDPAHWRLEERVMNDRVYYPVYHFLGGPHRIWGITGHILAHFLDVAFGWRHPDLDPTRVASDRTI